MKFSKRNMFSWKNVFLILFCSCFGFCSSRDTITINQTLQGSETIFSEGNRFKMGFFSPGNTSKYYVGIMYNNPSNAVVWVANRDKPMNDSRGTIAISEDGNLVVLDGQKTRIWYSDVSEPLSNTTTAQLMDNGNLVLKDGSTGRKLWESFSNPSDCLLRTMKLGTKALRSWRSPSEPFPGSFSFGIQLLNIPQVVIWNSSELYWRSGPWNKQIFIGISQMGSYYNNGFDFTTDSDGNTSLSFDYKNYQSENLYLHLGSNGSLLQTYWDQGKEQWEVTWESHSSECDEYGKCGSFGICNPGELQQVCSCLRGFKPKREVEWGNGNWSSGCVRKEDLQCDRNNSDVNKSKKDGFLKLQMVKVPDFSTWVPSSQGTCETDCSRNCSCLAYSFYPGIGCMHWTGSLIDLQQFSMGGADVYIRLAYSELDLKKESKHKKVIIATAVTIGLLAIAISAYFCWRCLAKHRGKKKQKRVIYLGKTSSPNMSGEDTTRAKLEELPVFDFEIIANATENFDPRNKLGQGGFGPVYKGKLEDGQEIAVKRLSIYSGQGQEEFMNEVVVISKLQHRNLVRLHGCCIEGGEKMLVYEFMPNGSLDTLLFDPQNEEFLDWSKRFMIIEGIGRGLLYLHRDSRLKIVHRDLKASNILLDEQLNPKISDFGLARIFGGNQHQANTQRVVGTYGYMAPEYAMDGRFSEKSDVYSFGVLLLEIVSGRKNSGFYHDEFAISLPAHAWKMWNEERAEEVVDPRIYDRRFEMNMKRCVHVGLLCVQEYPEDRPNVSTVLSMLSSEIAELPGPNQPAFIGRKSCPDTDSSKQSNLSVNSTTITVIEGR
ncbi:G-type lectin S-receptor-like serine/threonine-protein kinase At1g11300 [Ipomoea triloba]|uniref:G-type lectin S-receptor-like serine/threonine-protein kinase At1g11300 n=1 Tax=Ipomoea triloba TaxID=35885 RepID=UPI00125DD94B|nr:G-type lectin S-receptor-like serine/threonine-protein kinase At1g11300 [Ipomoea triloba]